MVTSLTVIIRCSKYDFLLTFHRNHASFLNHFQDIASYLSKVANRAYKCVGGGICRPRWGYPLEFHTIPGLLCGVVRMMLTSTCD